MTAKLSPEKGDTASGPIVPSTILAVLILIGTEIMLFGGLISAFVIAESAASAGTWPPPDQPRLPASETLINTVALLLSGLCMNIAVRRNGDDDSSAGKLILAALALGTFFIVFQGYEWVVLLGEGLTLTSSRLGSFFYVIVGTHGLHAVGGLVALGYGYARYRRDELSDNALKAISLFWYFVVLLWPLLYWQVYL